MTLTDSFDYVSEDAEIFAMSVGLDVSEISAEIDRSQTRRENARQKGWTWTMGYEAKYESALRRYIQE